MNTNKMFILKTFHIETNMQCKVFTITCDKLSIQIKQIDITFLLKNKKKLKHEFQRWILNCIQ